VIQRGNKVLFFPVETTVRELDFRLVLGMLCARPGWQIVVGDHELLFKVLLKTRNAVAVLKNVTGGKRPWKYRRFKELNHRVIHLDEEGAIYEEGPERWREELSKRIDVRELQAEDHVCTWGRFQADYYRSLNPPCRSNIHVTGHPRFDLCRPKFKEAYQTEVDALRQKYGKFILINTNLLANNAAGPDLNLRLNKVRPEDKDKRTYYIEQFCYESRRQAHFVQLVNHLSDALPEHQIVFRPHPSENIHVYTQLFRHIPRTIVTRDGSLHAWLKSCQVLIHDGCTTAVEGFLSGTPVINYHPIQDPRFDIVLPNLVGRMARTPAEVAEAIRKIDAKEDVSGTPPENIEKVEELILNFDREIDSFRLFAEVLHRCQDEAVEARLAGAWSPLAWHRLTDPLRRLAMPVPWLNRLLNRTDRGSVKFPPLDRRLLLSKKGTFERLTGTRVKIVFHSSKLFSIFAS
jgi:surface carbohydrate biosynthesis protein